MLCFVFRAVCLVVVTPLLDTTGFSSWNKASERLNSHVGTHSSAHHGCTVRWKSFLCAQSKGGYIYMFYFMFNFTTRIFNIIYIYTYIGSVYQQMGESQRMQIRENREYLSAILDAILFLCKQELALRGHNEGKASENKGYFLELLDLLCKRDVDFRKRYETRPRNATYTHPEIQNELIEASAKSFLRKLKLRLQTQSTGQLWLMK